MNFRYTIQNCIEICEEVLEIQLLDSPIDTTLPFCVHITNLYKEIKFIFFKYILIKGYKKLDKYTMLTDMDNPNLYKVLEVPSRWKVKHWKTIGKAILSNIVSRV
jgi:hypothetical protein